MKHAVTIALLSAFTLTGCNSGKRIAKANDNLRIEREQLKEQVTALENENAELHVKIAELLQSTDSELSEDVLAAMPRVASIELTRYCSIWTEGGASEARFFVVPKDGMGRFVPAVGKLVVSVSEYEKPNKPPEPDDLARNEHVPTIGMQTLNALEIRDSFVSGLSGSSYMIQVPLTSTPPEQVMLVAYFEDALTGKFHSVSRIIDSYTD